MTKFKLIFFTLIILVMPKIVWSAGLLDVSLNKTNFVPGEEIKAQAVFINLFKVNFIGILSCAVASLEPGFPIQPAAEQLNLAAGEKSKPLSCNMFVSDAMPAGIYNVVADIRDESGQIITETKKTLIITGTKKTFTAELNICADSACQTNKSVFIAGEPIYAVLNNSEINATLEAIIKNAQTGEEKKIDFKQGVAQIDSQITGSYIVSLKINKEGYESITLDKDFAVIQSQAVPKSIAQEGGIKQNPSNWTSGKIIFIFVIILLLGFLIAISRYFIRKKKSDINM